LVQRIEPGRMMRWSDIDISFVPEDHPEIELSDRNLPFMVKLPIGWYKVAKTLIDNKASLNLIMRKTFIEMGLNLKDLISVHDTFHGIISEQSSISIRGIDLEVSYGIGDNKRKEVLMFDVATYDIRYNCILRRPFLLKFMAVIHTAYATLKMHDPTDVITIKAHQRDALACENMILTYARRFGEKASQDEAAKVAKTHDGSASFKSPVPKPPTIGSPRPPLAKTGAYGASTSNQQHVDQPMDGKKEEDDKEVPVNYSNLDKKLRISTGLGAK
jgi:hypothetical protein